MSHETKRTPRFAPGTLVRLTQSDLFYETGVFIVIDSYDVYAEDQFGKDHNVCKILQSSTGRVFEWYVDILEEIK